MIYLYITEDRECPDYKWKCPDNGVCIYRTTLCDGDNNCGNNADETQEVCSKLNISCI